MKLFEKQDDQGHPQYRRPKTAKLLRRMKNKRERAEAHRNPEHPPTYGRYRGWVLTLTAALLLSGCAQPEPERGVTIRHAATKACPYVWSETRELR